MPQTTEPDEIPIREHYLTVVRQTLSTIMNPLVSDASIYDGYPHSLPELEERFQESKINNAIDTALTQKPPAFAEQLGAYDQQYRPHIVAAVRQRIGEFIQKQQQSSSKGPGV